MANKAIKKAMQKEVALARKKAQKVVAEAKAHLKHAEKQIDAKIKKNPEEAMAIAAAVGVALGALAAYGVMKRKK